MLRRVGCSPADARLLDDDAWVLAAHAANVRIPSAETIDLVVERLQALQDLDVQTTLDAHHLDA